MRAASFWTAFSDETLFILHNRRISVLAFLAILNYIPPGECQVKSVIGPSAVAHSGRQNTSTRVVASGFCYWIREHDSVRSSALCRANELLSSATGPLWPFQRAAPGPPPRRATRVG